MASDLSNIVISEVANTLGQLLGKSASCDENKSYEVSDFESAQAIKIEIGFEFSGQSVIWHFFVPTVSATKVEYLMLGGMGDIKESIDDEITDAVSEVISNICGSISTAVNAQGFDDVSGMKFELKSSAIVEISEIEQSTNSYSLFVTIEEDKLPVVIGFDELSLPYIVTITGEEVATSATPVPAAPAAAANNASSKVDINDEQLSNLTLLYNIKLKLSVRLGTKIFLLKDILRWDIGEIIELNQMVNEPLDILVNGIKIGEGEAVIVENKFGLKIRTIGDTDSRLANIDFG